MHGFQLGAIEGASGEELNIKIIVIEMFCINDSIKNFK